MILCQGYIYLYIYYIYTYIYIYILYLYIYIYIYVYIYIYNCALLVTWLLTQWLCANQCTWAYNLRLM